MNNYTLVQALQAIFFNKKRPSDDEIVCQVARAIDQSSNRLDDLIDAGFVRIAEVEAYAETNIALQNWDGIPWKEWISLISTWDRNKVLEEVSTLYSLAGVLDQFDHADLIAELEARLSNDEKIDLAADVDWSEQ